MSSSQEWRFEIQTHHRDRKVTTSSATGNFLAHNFGFSGEFRVCTNDPEEMKRNLLTEIENLSCQDCQNFRKTVIARLDEPSRFFNFRKSKDHPVNCPNQLSATWFLFPGIIHELNDAEKSAETAQKFTRCPNRVQNQPLKPILLRASNLIEKVFFSSNYANFEFSVNCPNQLSAT